MHVHNLRLYEQQWAAAEKQENLQHRHKVAQKVHKHSSQPRVNQVLRLVITPVATPVNMTTLRLVSTQHSHPSSNPAFILTSATHL